MTASQQSATQGDGASRSSLEHSATTGPSHGAQTSHGLSPHREESEVESYPNSPQYDDEDNDVFFIAGGETDRASQAEGHGGGEMTMTNATCQTLYQ